ncbi:hypothetical protein DL771_007744 [Monosporascus sp. 5C6A]|nr:hypothetical protein DL771_007744 [Monosporascus sp. 5C6A]
MAGSCIPPCANGIPQPLSTTALGQAESTPATANPPPPLPVTPFLTGPTPPATAPIPLLTPTATPPSPSPPASTSPTPAPGNCPTNLAGDAWEFPHLIVPMDHANPDLAYGPSCFWQISPNASMLHKFDIHPTDG